LISLHRLGFLQRSRERDDRIYRCEFCSRGSFAAFVPARSFSSWFYAASCPAQRKLLSPQHLPTQGRASKLNHWFFCTEEVTVQLCRLCSQVFMSRHMHLLCRVGFISLYQLHHYAAAAFSRKHNVTVWRPSVGQSVPSALR